jgi:hypothetical protein
MPKDSNIPPPPDTQPEIPIIPAGQARAVLMQAAARLARSIEDYTATAEAIARALDGGTAT